VLLFSSLQEQTGVAITGASWDAGDYRLWQGVDSDVILYMSRKLALATSDETGAPRATISRFLRWQDGAYQVTGGSASLTITCAPGLDSRALQLLKGDWLRVLLNSGYAGNPNPKFLPLPIRNGKLSLAMDKAIGRDLAAAGDSRTGAPGDTLTVAVDLTAAGADLWAQAVRVGARVSGGLSFTYEYPQMLPEADAKVTVSGLRVFTYLSSALRRGADGVIAGTADEISSAWDDLVRRGDVAIAINGTLPPEVEAMRKTLVATFADQARRHAFDDLFEPAPAAAPASNPDGASGGPRYALRWRQAADAADLSFTLSVEAWNWLTAELDTDLGSLLGRLDPGAINVVYTETSVPVSITVDPDPIVFGVAASLVFDSGHIPVTEVFGPSGGSASYTLMSNHPDAVGIRYNAKVSFAPASWPVIELKGGAKVADGGNRIFLDPHALVRRHTIYMYVRDGQGIKGPKDVSKDDYLFLNASFRSASFASPVRMSSRITPLGPVEFSYPVDPSGPPGEARLTAYGLVGGKPVQPREVALDPGEEAVFLLAGPGGFQVVAKNAVIPEDDPVAHRLLDAGARPVVRSRNGAAPEAGRGGGAGPEPEDDRSVSVHYQVELIPQPNPVSCWAASLAMVASYRDAMSYPPDAIASRAGMDIALSYGWPDIEKAVTTWDLRETGPASAMPSEWARLLQNNGPIWIVEVGAPYHAVVLTGIEGDGTADSTTVTINNPWPPAQGAYETKTFRDFDTEFGLGAGAGAMIVHAGRVRP